MLDYDGSQVLFRLACVAALRAREFADQAATEEHARGQAMERRQRERDQTIQTIVMTQAAAEGYANGVHLRANVAASGGWIDRWSALPALSAAAPGSPHQQSRPGLERELGAWRNYLLHADALARDRLQLLLLGAGLLRQGQSAVDLLTADLAERTRDQAAALFRWAEKATRVPAPTTNGWIAPDEM
jgi:hypothetical protein